MTEVRVAASYALVYYPAPESPRPLREALKAVCPQAPRRLNRFTELALTGALGCAGRAGIELPADCALYLATNYGNAGVTFRLVEETVLLRQPPMPVDFINVSGGSAGFYLAQVLGLRGRNNTIAAGKVSFEAALELAWGELALRPGLALVGGVEDVGYPLDVYRRRLGLPAGLAMAEISSWLLLDSRAEATGARVAEPRYFGEFSDLQAALAARPLTRVSLGGGLSVTERAALANPWCLPLAECGHADTAAAYAITSGFAQGAGAAFVHVGGDGAEGYYLLRFDAA